MVSNKKHLFLFLIGAAFLGLFGCTDPYANDESDENLVGTRLNAVSPLRDSAGTENESIALFDPTLKRVHQFDVQKMKKLRTLKVRFPDEKHYVLHDTNGNYIIDMSAKGVTIFDRDNNATNDPVSLIAKPKSAAFNPNLGYLIIYDELMNVGIIQLDANGDVIDSIGLGPVLGNDSIVAGDLMSTGTLVLSLSDGSLASVNIANTLAQRQWVYTTAATEFTNISWLAPAYGNNGRVIAKHSGGVALLNIATGATVQKINVDTDEFSFVKLSKMVDGHVVTKSKSDEIRLYYTDGNTLKTRAMYKQIYSLMSSQLDIATDSWMVIDGKTTKYYDPFSGDYNVTKLDRTMKRFRPSDLKVTETKGLPNDAQVFMSLNYFFALYPSELGYAVRQNYLTGHRTEMRGFNVDEFDRY